MIPKILSGLFDGILLAVGVACLGAATLAQGGRFSHKLDILTHFAPIWLAGAMAVAIWGLVLARADLRGLIGGVGLAGMLAALALLAPEYLRPIAPPAPADAPNQIRIVQYNAWDQNRDIPGSVRWILAQHADVVVIEELEPRFREAMIATGQFHYTRGMLRTGIFTRAAPLRSPFRLGAPWEEWPGIARVAVPGPDGAPIQVVGLHLTWPTDAFQGIQSRRVETRFAGLDRSRMILVGDFNLTPWSFALQRLDHSLGLTRRERAIFSWPAQPFARRHLTSPVPFLPIDHVYAGSAWRTVSVVRGPKQGSDHYPLVITLALKD